MLVSLADGADTAVVEAAVKDALEDFPTATVENRADYRETAQDELNQIVYLLYALLAMSIVISLFGIANSLFLAIHERTGELGVLPAVGATRSQVRRVIRYESVNLPLLGGAGRWLAKKGLIPVLTFSTLLMAYEAFRYGAGYANH